jgi:hypothetical protein
MNKNPCGGNCFAVKKLVNKLEKENEFWKNEAAYYERRMIDWRRQCAASLPRIPSKTKKKKRHNPGHLKVVG